MKYYVFQISIFLFLLFSGCRQLNEKEAGAVDQQVHVAMDSINAIGALVMEHRVSHTDSGVYLARRAIRLAQDAGNDDLLLKAYNIMGNAWSLSMSDSAFVYYSKALDLKPAQPVHPEKPMLLYNIAMLHVSAANFKTAIVLLDSAIKEAGKVDNFIVISNALNSLGTIYTDLGNDSVAKMMYDSALSQAVRHHAPLQTAAALGNLAKMEKDPGKAEKQERMAIQYLQDCKDGAEPMASLYVNYGSGMTNPDSAIACYSKAISLINKRNAPITLLAAYNNLVYSYLEKGENTSAERYLLNFAFPLAKEIQSDAWMANLYDTYSDVLSAEGKYKEAMGYEKKSIELLARADKKAADKQVRLLGAMLELKNKEAMVRAAQQESEQTRSAFVTARFWFIFIILFALFVAVTLSFFLVRNHAISRGKMIAAAKKIILVDENEKTILGRDLHDLTGHKLLNFTNFMESASFTNPEEQKAGMHMLVDLQDQLQKLSHRFKRNWLEKFSFSRNIEAMCRETIRFNQINLSTAQPEEYPELSEETKMHLYRIIQELLTNAVKYAKTARISLVITVDRHRLTVRYEDDGPGFDREKVSEKGIGIINIYERVRLMNGVADLDTRPGFGVSWEISVPVREKKSILDKISGGAA